MSNFQVIETTKAPAAVGPYCQGILPKTAGSPVYLSGQLGLDPETTSLVPNGVEAETKQAFQNLRAVLAEIGLTTDSILSMDVLLTDINNYNKVNAVYAEEFGNHKPARAAYQVAALPLGANVEIKAIAWKPSS